MDDELKTGYLRNVLILVLFFSAVFISVSLFYFLNFRGPLGSQEVFGQFGDFFGGVLNPLLSFAAILLIIWSIRLQIQELSDTRKELKKSADAQAAIVDKNIESLELQRQLFSLRQSVCILEGVRREIDGIINVDFIPINGKLYSLRDVAVSADDVRIVYLNLVRNNNFESNFDRQLGFNIFSYEMLISDYNTIMVHFIKGILPDTSMDYYLSAYFIDMKRAVALQILSSESSCLACDALNNCSKQ